MHVLIVVDLDLAVVVAEDDVLAVVVGVVDVFHEGGDAEVGVQVQGVLGSDFVDVAELVGDHDLALGVDGDVLHLLWEVGLEGCRGCGCEAG